MKKYTILLAALMIFCINAGKAQRYFPEYASYQKVASFDTIVKHYLLSLESPNEGVVISTLAHIGRIKLYFPERRFPEFEKKISELSTTGNSPNIRYRAFLVASIFNNPAAFAKESLTEFEDGEELFSALAGRLQLTLLGANDTSVTK